MLGHSRGVARTMEDADDYELAFVMKVIDGVVAGEADAKLFARRAGHRETTERLAIALDLVYEPVRCRFGSFDGDVKPDFGEVGFGRVGQAEGERSANSFLPLAMMRSASKSFTRPAATSAKPLSMSLLSAASSSI